MVGTTPMSSPAFRQAIACSCMAIADSMTAALPDGVLVLRGGEGAAAHVLVELARGGFDRLTEFGVLADELRDVVWVESEDVLDHQDLGVATHPRADADGGHSQCLRDSLPECGGNALEHDRERAGLFEGFGIVEGLLRRFVAAALHPQAAELVGELRCQPEVTHDRNTHRGQLLRVADDAAAAF